MGKEVLALDIDDVVVKHVEALVRWSNTTYGTSLTIEDYTQVWHELWNMHDEEEIERRKREFFTDEIFAEFEVVEGAAEAIAELSKTREIVGVTARRDYLRSVTEQALETIAPGAVSDVILATYHRGGQRFTRSKADICLGIGATHLIDDHLHHCLAVSKVGLNAILFGDYPWNRMEGELPESIVRARDWKDVLDHFGVNNPEV